jgi:rubrerythrin
MAEGICYVCNQSFTEADKGTVVDKIVGHMMAAHHGGIWGDAMQAKNAFDKCPVCGADIGKPLAKCPNCGADLIEHYARKVASRYVH